MRAAIAAGRSFGSLHVAWHTKVDFFVAGASPLDARELARRVPVRLPAEPGRTVFFASAEDIVLRKLEWFRRSGGVLERQLRDVVGVLKLQASDLDLAYLQSTAAELRLTEDLQRCMEDAGSTD